MSISQHSRSVIRDVDRGEGDKSLEGLLSNPIKTGYVMSVRVYFPAFQCIFTNTLSSHVNMHIHINTYIHTHTHTLSLSLSHTHTLLLFPTRTLPLSPQIKKHCMQSFNVENILFLIEVDRFRDRYTSQTG